MDRMVGISSTVNRKLLIQKPLEAPPYEQASPPCPPPRHEQVRRLKFPTAPSLASAPKLLGLFRRLGVAFASDWAAGSAPPRFFFLRKMLIFCLIRKIFLFKVIGFVHQRCSSAPPNRLVLSTRLFSALARSSFASTSSGSRWASESVCAPARRRRPALLQHKPFLFRFLIKNINFSS